MKLPKSLTTVTPFSKSLALCMFILFPILGFFLGMTYQKMLSPQDFLSRESNEKNEVITPTPTVKTTIPEGKACTMEAKLCPDGSYVGRTGPNCEFAACPQ